MGDKYTRIAKQKIAELINRQSFTQILSIDSEHVYIELGDKQCKVNTHGRVTWVERTRDF